jgi:hypothetical protein
MEPSRFRGRFETHGGGLAKWPTPSSPTDLADPGRVLPVPTAPARRARAGCGDHVEARYALPVGLARTLIAEEQVERQAVVVDLRATVGSRDRAELARADTAPFG